MKLKDLRKVFKGRIAVFNYKDEPIYNDYEKKYPIEYLDEKDVVEIISADGLLKIKVLA